MNPFLAGVFCLVVAVVGGTISANAGVIASCGSMEGYTYHFQDNGAGKDTQWVRDSLNSTTIFLGTNKVEEVVLKSKMAGDDWTRSASDYGATVVELNRVGSFHHVLVHWGSATELYALDTENKTVSLVSQKSKPFRLTVALVGKCE